MIPVGCCWGAVWFELARQPSTMAQCHCFRCRKLGASVFVFVQPAQFRWTSGEALVARYVPELPHRFSRAFCSCCGTALGEPGAGSERFPVVADTLDVDPGVRIHFHEFVAKLPAWGGIGDGAPRFAGHPIISKDQGD